MIRPPATPAFSRALPRIPSTSVLGASPPSPPGRVRGRAASRTSLPGSAFRDDIGRPRLAAVGEFTPWKRPIATHSCAPPVTQSAAVAHSLPRPRRAAALRSGPAPPSGSAASGLPPTARCCGACFGASLPHRTELPEGRAQHGSQPKDSLWLARGHSHGLPCATVPRDTWGQLYPA